ncbi:MAG: ATP phosphoribosyltransferase regulatory subunit, partial [Clostridiales bacterium]|nr:ATP phosphoribosyltransferase regulatory subunit [Clostridiales bacterium]
QYGYQDIQTPTFEFFNVFGKEIGTTPSRDLYKFFDKEGNTLVLRPDFTPAIARSAVKYYTESDFPVKLCYMGNTFTNSSSLQGRLKETTQCGAELIGEGSTACDAEILALSVASLKAAGLREFQISVGHAGILTQLLLAAGISDEQESTLRDLISNKNFFGVTDFVNSLNMDASLKELFGLLGIFDLSKEELVKTIDKSQDYPGVCEVLRELKLLTDYLEYYGINRYISIEPGLISNIHYYSGIIFRGYTYGTGEPVVKGGRYDRLLGHFGKDAPAIGFAIVVDSLLNALQRQRLIAPATLQGVLLVTVREYADRAISRAQELRSRGEKVCLLIKDEPMTPEAAWNYADRKQLAKVETIYGIE